MAEGSRMMLCVMVLTVLAFNPLASLSPAPARPTVGDVPGRTILEEQSQAGGVCLQAFHSPFKLRLNHYHLVLGLCILSTFI